MRTPEQTGICNDMKNMFLPQERVILTVQIEEEVKALSEAPIEVLASHQEVRPQDLPQAAVLAVPQGHLVVIAEAQAPQVRVEIVPRHRHLHQENNH